MAAQLVELSKMICAHINEIYWHCAQQSVILWKLFFENAGRVERVRKLVFSTFAGRLFYAVQELHLKILKHSC